ncbi:hypothetical protein [Carboxylicivirga sp. RSCT41]
MKQLSHYIPLLFVGTVLSALYTINKADDHTRTVLSNTQLKEGFEF